MQTETPQISPNLNDTESDSTHDWHDEDYNGTLIQRFERVANLHALRVAVQTSSTQYTYRELQDIANRITHVVNLHCQSNATATEAGVSQERIALLIQKDGPLFGAILGVLKAGHITVPLDANTPTSRALEILHDCTPKLLFCDHAHLEQAENLIQQASCNIKIILLDEISCDAQQNLPFPKITPDHDCNVLYTSGSTGKPKGVVQTHRSTLHHVGKYSRLLGLNYNDRVTLLASCSVGQGFKTMLCALLNGATLCPFDVKLQGITKLTQWVEELQITVYISSATLFQYFMRELGTKENTSSTQHIYPHLRLVRIGSEALLSKDFEQFKRLFSDSCRLVNSLSSTETGNIALFFMDKNTTVETDIVPVGRVSEGCEVLLLDEQGNAVEAGSVGEITVRSRFMARGYWRNEEATKQKFRLVNGEELFYHTGDLGRFDSQGYLHHCGRKDFQVKIRGFRVELNEVENILRTHPYLQDVAIQVKEEGDEKTLIAYVTVNGEACLRVSELRHFASERLPAHAIPAHWIQLSSMPLTLIGKIDRSALKVAAGKMLASADTVPYIAPRNTIEQAMTQIWQSILGQQDIGIRDNFLHLGGHSLQAAEMISQIKAQLNRDLPMSILLQAPTIEQLCGAILQRDLDSDNTTLVTIQPGVKNNEGKTKTPFFIVSPGAVLFMKNLERHMDASRPIYGLQNRGLFDGHEPMTNLKEIAALHLESLRTVQPHGPYLLGGRCFGGIVAFEMAQQLTAEGEHVNLLIIFDSGPPHFRNAGWKKIPKVRHIRRHISNYIKQLSSQSSVSPQNSSMLQEMEASPDYSSHEDSFMRLKAANRFAKQRYHATKWNGKIVLFRSAESANKAAKKRHFLWQELTPQPLEWSVIDGAHHDMFKEPNVRELSRKLQGYLDKFSTT